MPARGMDEGYLTTADDILRLYNALREQGAEIWLDGGWAVDALLGEQTRPHSDADIVIEQQHLPIMHALLESWGYRDVPRDDSRANNFVLGDDHGHEIDVHVIVLDENGDGQYGNDGVYYADALTGSGSINGQPVRCISAEWLVKFHTGYTLGPTDYHDVLALCARFGIPVPDEYRTDAP